MIQQFGAQDMSTWGFRCCYLQADYSTQLSICSLSLFIAPSKHRATFTYMHTNMHILCLLLCLLVWLIV